MHQKVIEIFNPAVKQPIAKIEACVDINGAFIRMLCNSDENYHTLKNSLYPYEFFKYDENTLSIYFETNERKSLVFVMNQIVKWSPSLRIYHLLPINAIASQPVINLRQFKSSSELESRLEMIEKYLNGHTQTISHERREQLMTRVEHLRKELNEMSIDYAQPLIQLRGVKK